MVLMKANVSRSINRYLSRARIKSQRQHNDEHDNHYETLQQRRPHKRRLKLRQTPFQIDDGETTKKNTTNIMITTRRSQNDDSNNTTITTRNACTDTNILDQGGFNRGIHDKLSDHDKTRQCYQQEDHNNTTITITTTKITTASILNHP